MKNLALLAMAVLISVGSIEAKNSLAALQERAARHPDNPRAIYELTKRYCEEDSVVQAIESWKKLVSLDTALASDLFLRTKVATFLGLEPFTPNLISDSAGEAGRFSPDGRWIVFQAVRGGRTNIGIMDINGEHFKWIVSPTISEDFDYISPNFAGSATKLVYLKRMLQSSNKSSIIYHDLETGEQQELLGGSMEGIESPGLFPESSVLLFSYMSPDTKSREIGIYDLKAGKLTDLTHDIYTEFYPHCSQRGDLIAYNTDQWLQLDIYLMDTKGRVKERVTDWSGHDLNPDFGDRDRKIAFASYRHGRNQADIFIYDRKSKEVMPVTLNEANDYYPDLSDDGNWIIFSSTRGEDGRPRVYLVSLNQPVSLDRLLEKIKENEEQEE